MVVDVVLVVVVLLVVGSDDVGACGGVNGVALLLFFRVVEFVVGIVMIGKDKTWWW